VRQLAVTFGSDQQPLTHNQVLLIEWMHFNSLSFVCVAASF